MTDRETALQCKGRCGTVSQSGTGQTPPLFYGRIVEVHPGGDYLKFLGGSMRTPRWYHRRDVKLHPLLDGEAPR